MYLKYLIWYQNRNKTKSYAFKIENDNSQKWMLSFPYGIYYNNHIDHNELS